MTTEASKFQVGIFVIVASIIALGATLWLGASRFFEETETFVTYFSESVQGLDPGSSVKYRGVPAGRVSAIRIAPDGNLIEVVMDLDAATTSYMRGDQALRAKLELTGITGLRYVEIERRSGAALHQAPELAFDPPYPVIPSARSSFQAVQTALGHVYDRIMELDLAGISTDARAALQSVSTLLADPRIDSMIANFNEASQSAMRVTANVERITREIEVQPTLENAAQASAAARDLFVDLNEVTRQRLDDAAVQVSDLAQSAHQVVLSLQYTVERLDRTLASVRTLTDQVREQPSLLLFSEPPAQSLPPRGPR
jgi:ABC-type transporter Mla subunit MlaD